jgi:hypothetical protein
LAGVQADEATPGEFAAHHEHMHLNGFLPVVHHRRFGEIRRWGLIVHTTVAQMSTGPVCLPGSTPAISSLSLASPAARSTRSGRTEWSARKRSIPSSIEAAGGMQVRGPGLGRGSRDRWPQSTRTRQATHPNRLPSLGWSRHSTPCAATAPQTFETRTCEAVSLTCTACPGSKALPLGVDVDKGPNAPL